jgi:hypothetical protein
MKSVFIIYYLTESLKWVVGESGGTEVDATQVPGRYSGGNLHPSSVVPQLMTGTKIIVPFDLLVLDINFDPRSH